MSAPGAHRTRTICRTLGVCQPAASALLLCAFASLASLSGARCARVEGEGVRTTLRPRSMWGRWMWVCMAGAAPTSFLLLSF